MFGALVRPATVPADAQPAQDAAGNILGWSRMNADHTTYTSWDSEGLNPITGVMDSVDAQGDPWVYDPSTPISAFTSMVASVAESGATAVGTGAASAVNSTVSGLFAGLSSQTLLLLGGVALFLFMGPSLLPRRRR